jgi:hypothetical protein
VAGKYFEAFDWGRAESGFIFTAIFSDYKDGVFTAVPVIAVGAGGYAIIAGKVKTFVFTVFSTGLMLHFLKRRLLILQNWPVLALGVSFDIRSPYALILLHFDNERSSSVHHHSTKVFLLDLLVIHGSVGGISVTTGTLLSLLGVDGK